MRFLDMHRATGDADAISSCKVSGNLKEPIFYGNYSFNTGHVKGLTVVDYFICFVTLTTSTVIGLYVAWKDHKRLGIEEYLAAGRTIDALPAGLSLTSTYMSAITLIGLPAEVYTFSTMYIWMAISYFFVCAATVNIYMPVFYQLKLLSAYQYLEKRFSRSVRVMASLFYVFQTMIYVPIVLFAPSVALNAVTGFNLWVSILIVGVACTIYTAMGGMKAVIWTDAFQFVVMISGMVVFLVVANMTVGSWEDVIQSAKRRNILIFGDARLDPTVRHSVWSILIGGFMSWVALYGCNQTQIHRCFACRTLKEAKTAMWINYIFLLVILFIGIAIGLFMSAFYEHCDPKAANFVSKSNEMIPLFMMDILTPTTGLSGIYMAALLSGALSSVSSGLNAVSTVLLEDCVRIFTKNQIHEERARLISQMICILFGGMSLELAYIMSNLEDILEAAVSFNGALASPVLGVFSLGMFFPHANAKGAFSGLLSSFLFICYMAFGKNFSSMPLADTAVMCVSNCNTTALMNVTGLLASASARSSTTLLHISYLWLSVIAVLICIIVGGVVSFLTGLEKPSNIDPRLIVPLADVVFPFYYMSEETREKLRFGIRHTGKWDKERAMSRFSSEPNVDMNLFSEYPTKNEFYNARKSFASMSNFDIFSKFRESEV